MRILMLLVLFITTNAYAQVDMANQRKPLPYHIGTGFTFSYFEGNPSISVDSLHFFRDMKRPFDHALLKFGIGVNFNSDSFEDSTYNFSAAIGYMYMQDQYHSKSNLNRFGAGATLDYTYIGNYVKEHALGVTLYAVLNTFVLGIGGGVIFDDEYSPYINTSFAVVF